jgi:hypothetical protein
MSWGEKIFLPTLPSVRDGGWMTLYTTPAAQPAPVSNETMQKLREKLESPSYTHALAYQNIREALEIVMRWIDDYCETGPENDFEKVEKIANAALEATPPAAPVKEPVECQYGNGGYACCEGGPCKADEQNNAAPVQQTCNCRWDGEVQVQQCTLHQAHVDAIHEWAERAKAAEAKLVAQPAPVQERTCKQSLQVWVISNGKGAGQFSWDSQDERFWTRMEPAAQPAPVPLTDEVIERALKAACMHSTPESRKDMRRAIEAAHGITKKGQL